MCYGMVGFEPTYSNELSLIYDTFQYYYQGVTGELSLGARQAGSRTQNRKLLLYFLPLIGCEVSHLYDILNFCSKQTLSLI